MKKFIVLLFGIITTIHLSAQNQYNLIPQPKKITAQSGIFIVKKGTNVSVSSEIFTPAAELLIRQANNVSNLGLSISETTSSSGIHFKLNTEFGISLDSYYNISLSVIEFALEMYLGKDIVDVIVYYLETKSFPVPDNTINELLGEDGKPIIIENIDQLWDLIIRLKPDILNEK